MLGGRAVTQTWSWVLKPNPTTSKRACGRSEKRFMPAAWGPTVQVQGGRCRRADAAAARVAGVGLDVEFERLADVEVIEATVREGGGVEEDLVRAAVDLDEAKAAVLDEVANLSGCHVYCFFLRGRRALRPP